MEISCVIVGIWMHVRIDDLFLTYHFVGPRVLQLMKDSMVLMPFTTNKKYREPIITLLKEGSKY